ncbi:exonuclease domain-containing protein [Acidithrix sp. C25]|uniref:exonuclease domain-containing protein n=1 Tax=Acidithrix sp. C25 TaxID=1671482 RepID=UPI00191B95D5|nr:exonuclease domain-containing protein [Acidithrix sp. C25]
MNVESYLGNEGGQLETDKVQSWLCDNTFLVFDLETTGVDVFVDLPVSYALLIMSGDNCVLESYSLVDPGIQIPIEAAKIHGISDAAVRRHGLSLGDALGLIVDQLMRAYRNGWFVVGMNISYDLSLLDNVLKRELGVGLGEMGISPGVVDTLVLDRHYDPYRKGRRTLDALGTRYNVAKGELHNALEDCKVTYRVLREMATIYPAIADLEPSTSSDVLAGFHHKWVEGYNKWARAKSNAEIDDNGWPILLDRGR